MKLLLVSTVACAATFSSAFAQTDVLLRFDHPGGPHSGWGHALVAVGDLDGDGASELAVGTFGHGGGESGTVHSGRTGFLLFTLQAPSGPLFFGDAIAALADETGDGLPEIAVIGSHSGATGSPEGMLIVHSGADGAVLRQSIPPAGVTVISHLQTNVDSLGDVDGDGSADVLCRTTLVPTGGQLGLTMLSGRTAAPIYSVAPTPPANFVGNAIARVPDRDGDGFDDLALPVRSGTTVHVELRSGATGALIGSFAAAGLDELTGNGEPFLSIADVDGDGLRDLASGAIFGGVIRLHSSADGTLLRRWDCGGPGAPCFGSRVVEVGDMNGNGHADLVALELEAFGGEGLRICGLDPTTKPRLFAEHLPAMSGGYTTSRRLVALPGVDLRGVPTFALFEDLSRQVAVRRFVPRLGTN